MWCKWSSWLILLRYLSCMIRFKEHRLYRYRTVGYTWIYKVITTFLWPLKSLVAIVVIFYDFFFIFSSQLERRIKLLFMNSIFMVSFICLGCNPICTINLIFIRICQSWQSTFLIVQICLRKYHVLVILEDETWFGTVVYQEVVHEHMNVFLL